MSGPIGNIFHDLCCEGCKHLQYTASDGQISADPVIAAPHSRCGYFKAYIPLRKDGSRRVFYEAPADCPTRLALAQGRLL